jgi:hypothetical protein
MNRISVDSQPYVRHRHTRWFCPSGLIPKILFQHPVNPVNPVYSYVQKTYSERPDRCGSQAHPVLHAIIRGPVSDFTVLHCMLKLAPQGGHWRLIEDSSLADFRR